MSDDTFQAFSGACKVRKSEPEAPARSALIAPPASDSLSARHRIPGEHPVSVADAYAYFQAMIGEARDSTFRRAVSLWWERLIAAETPEEKLTCERMIRAGYTSFGWHQWEHGRDLTEKNRLQREEERAVEAIAAEQRAIDRWR